MTGADNRPVLESIRYLAEWQRLHEVRMLMVPGRNDSPQEVERTARWLHDIDPTMRIKLVGFRRAWVRPQFAHIPEADPAHLRALADVIRGVGIDELAIT
jgi:pyruvate-formate lyase-activating enzyme